MKKATAVFIFGICMIVAAHAAAPYTEEEILTHVESGRLLSAMNGSRLDQTIQSLISSDSLHKREFGEILRTQLQKEQELLPKIRADFHRMEESYERAKKLRNIIQ